MIRRLRLFARCFGVVARCSPRPPRLRRRLAVLAIGLLLILFWQQQFWKHLNHPPATWRHGAAMGLVEQHYYVYFYYYLGLYPVTSLVDHGYSLAEAHRTIDKLGKSLLMEYARPIFGPLRNGDHGRIWLYMPAAWWRGTPKDPTVQPANAAAFMLALMAAFTSFWWAGRPALGAALVMVIGSSPYQLFEIYGNENVFGWTGIAALLLLALTLPFMDGKRGCRKKCRWVFLLPLAAGLLMGSIRHIRSEPMGILLSAVVAIALLVGATRWRRAALVATLLGAYATAAMGWTAYFLHVIKVTHDVVTKAGGYPHPAASSPRVNHSLWLPIWEGLGDYDTKYGHKWDDIAANFTARPLLQAKYGITYPPSWDGRYAFRGAFLDAKQHYMQLPCELPHFFDVLRDDALSHILGDPLWYLRILGHRVWAILTDTSPLALKFANRTLVQLPISGLLFLPILAALIAARSRLFVQLVCFTLPLSLPALVVFSKQGMTHSGLYHLFAVVIALVLVAETAILWGRLTRRAARRDRRRLAMTAA